MKLYHQTGFRYNWNADAQNQAGHGDGLIFSPVNISYEKLEEQNILIRQKSFLDPQIYLPTFAKRELETYPYFPSARREGFKTAHFDTDAYGIAKDCINVQIGLQFLYLVIPTRYYEEIDMPSNYIDKMDEEYIEPFGKCLSEIEPDIPVLLTIILNSSILKDESRRDEYLDWITGLTSFIDGVYLIIEHAGSDKQIKDYDVLLETLKFIHVLKDNGLQVHVGYCNTEGLLYSVANPDSITMGSYENLRMFKIKRFEEDDGGVQRGPKARLYISKLLQWVSHDYFPGMKDLYSEFDNLIDDSPHIDECFELGYQWHFQKKAPYLHFFDVYSKQVSTLGAIADTQSRIDFLKTLVNDALDTFDAITNSGVRLDGDSDGSHLNHWLSVLTSFEKYLKNP